jgi:hypothetical protein
MTKVLIQANVQMGFGTILSILYETINISKNLRPHVDHLILYVNCGITFYFDSGMFYKIFNEKYLLTNFDEVIVSDEPYDGFLNYTYTRGFNTPGKVDWDIFLSSTTKDLNKFYDNSYGIINKACMKNLGIEINEEFNIFSDYIKNQYSKIENYETISFRGKNMSDLPIVIESYMDQFKQIIESNETVYVCGTSKELKDKLKSYTNVFLNEMYINEEDFLPNVYDDNKMEQIVLLVKDILYLNDSKKIHHFTYFHQLSYFLFIPYINKVPIETYYLSQELYD